MRRSDSEKRNTLRLFIHFGLNLLSLQKQNSYHKRKVPFAPPMLGSALHGLLHEWAEGGVLYVRATVHYDWKRL